VIERQSFSPPPALTRAPPWRPTRSACLTRECVRPAGLTDEPEIRDQLFALVGAAPKSLPRAPLRHPDDASLLRGSCLLRRRPTNEREARPHPGSHRERLGVRTGCLPGSMELLGTPRNSVLLWNLAHHGGATPCRQVQQQKSLKPSLAIACSLQHKPTPLSFVRDYSAWPAIGCARP
jgi:hypothetical protein